MPVRFDNISARKLSMGTFRRILLTLMVQMRLKNDLASKNKMHNYDYFFSLILVTYSVFCFGMIFRASQRYDCFKLCPCVAYDDSLVSDSGDNMPSEFK